MVPHHLPSPPRPPPTSGNVFTSMKPGRPKKSKVAYISRQDLMMMLLSALLSCMLAISIILIIRYGGPIFVDALLEVLAYPFTMIEGQSNATHIGSQFTPIVTKQIGLIESLNCTYFDVKQSFPLLFSILGREGIVRGVAEIIDERSQNLEIASVSTRTEQCLLDPRSLSMFRMSEMHDFESHLASSSLSHCFSSGRALIDSQADLASLIQPPLLQCSMDRAHNDVIEFTSFNGKPSLEIERRTKDHFGYMFSSNRTSLYELIAGEKRWFLYEQNKLPSVGFNPLDSIMNWVEDVLPVLSAEERPWEIIQLPGQFVYIPDGNYVVKLGLLLSRVASVIILLCVSSCMHYRLVFCKLYVE
jgi:hypothetical protein